MVPDGESDCARYLRDSPSDSPETENSEAQFVHLRTTTDLAANLVPSGLIDGFREEDPGPKRIAQECGDVFNDGLSVRVRSVYDFNAASSTGGHVNVVDADASPGDDLQ